jgi:C-terminal processing protease CtpA/Prc
MSMKFSLKYIQLKSRFGYPFLFALVGLLFICSCNRDSEEGEAQLTPNEKVSTVLEDFYLWYKELPDINPDEFANPSELLEYARYKPLDKWSYITTKTEFDQYFESGEYVGHGLSIGLDEQGNYRVAFVFNSSGLKNLGVKRGWKIVKLNGQTVNGSSDRSIFDLLGADEPGVTNTFVFEDFEGITREITSVKSALKINSVLYADTLMTNNEITGYIVFKSFIGPAIAELDTVFKEFQDLGVKNLILDLRYNGGGRMDVAEHLAGLLAGETARGNILVQYEHNDKQSARNTAQFIPVSENSILLSKLVVISSRLTASASEVIINGLQPFMDLTLVGDSTHGKPVGMYSFEFPEDDLVLLPVTFKLANADGYGEYYDGLLPSLAARDDITSYWGDMDEDMFAAAVNYLRGMPVTKSLKKDNYKNPLLKLKGLEFEIGAI